VTAPWPRGVATGIGSLPGTDVVDAVATTLDDLPDLPYLPELPARGPGADLLGRSAARLVDLPVELYAARWRVAARPGRDLRRARDLWERDLDALTERADGYAGPLKIQIAGPWTLAAGLDLPVGGVLLRDPGAVRDLTGSLAEAVAGYVAEVARRVPGATVLLQLDEPSLPAVLAGRIPTESGLGTLRSVPDGEVTAALRAVVEAAGVPVVVHCCAPDVPVGLLREAGAAALALDLSLVGDRLDPIGEALDAGLGLFAGAVPTRPPGRPRPPAEPAARRGADRSPVGAQDPVARADDAEAPAGGLDSGPVADRVRRLWRALGFPPARAADQVVVTPACGLAGASPGYARAALRACREAGRRLADDD
jgi:hypothetical protein